MHHTTVCADSDVPKFAGMVAVHNELRELLACTPIPL